MFCSNKKLDEIIDLLNRLSTRMDNMATTIAQFDAALSTLSTEVGTIVADVTNLLAKISAGQDFTTELATVQSSLASLQGADAAAQAVLNPPAPGS